MRQAIIIGAISIGILCGCAGNRVHIGSQRVVEQIPGKRPRWIGKSLWEADGRYFYVGAVTNRADMALGLREARAEGEKKLVEQVRQRIRTEFGSAIEGQNIDRQTGTYVRDLIAKVSDNVEVSGVQISETFTEKVEEATAFGVKYVYNCHAKLQLPRADYMEARQRAVGGMLERARNERNAKAEASLSSAFRKLQEEAKSPVPAKRVPETER